MKTRYPCLIAGMAALCIGPALADDHDEDEIEWEVAEVFFELNYEVLVCEESWNQTAVESCFLTEEDD